MKSQREEHADSGVGNESTEDSSNLSLASHKLSKKVVTPPGQDAARVKRLLGVKMANEIILFQRFPKLTNHRRNVPSSIRHHSNVEPLHAPQTGKCELGLPLSLPVRNRYVEIVAKGYIFEIIRRLMQ
jgi:hypothetical protein